MVTYRLASEKDYKQINNFNNRIYNSNRTLEQFYWEFHNCPYGESIYVIAEDKGKIVGTNCVIPIDLITSDKIIIKSGKSEDTLVDPAYRGQKIFYKIYDFLFEQCKEKGIQVIWGFTSAKKPFKKIGFEIPFDHQQSLMVNNIWQSYKYLSSLNSNNKFIDKLKIFGLSCLSKIKSTGKYKGKLDGYTIKTGVNIIDGVDVIIESNLSTVKSSFAILQNSEFQEWRIYQNPNYYKIHTFGFFDSSDKLIALIVLNSQPNNVAFINQSSFNNTLSSKEKTNIIQLVSRMMFDLGIVLIRNWHFNTNSINKSEIEIYTNSKFTFLKRGVGFVWKDLNNTDYKPENFFLSRISTQGVI
jgi:N-acetylglutamate synthase-like GNAT family acetyltransferase